MFQEGQCRHRREIRRQHRHKTLQIAACRTLRQRASGGVIHLDPPALQRRDHRLGQLPVRRDKRGGPAGGLQHLAHGKRNQGRLIRSCLAIDDRQPGKGVAAKLWMGVAKPPPVGCQARRLEHLAHQIAAAPADIRRASKAGPVGNRFRHHLEVVQEHRQLMLRMARFLAHQPPVVGGAPIETRQHHMTVRQVRHTGDEFAGGGEGACRARDHDQIFRPALAPQAAAQPHQPVAPVSSVDDALFGKNGRPAVDQDGQERQDILPMAGKPVRQKITELFRRGVGIAQRIKKPGQGFGKPHGLWRGWRHIPEAKPPQQPRQPQLAAKRVHRRRHIRRIRGKSQNVGRILLDIANRINPRQQGGLIPPHLQKGGAKRLRGAA